jgi:ABC-2 type transport system ATP-binding protein
VEPETVISVRSLRKCYGDVVALDGVGFEVARGESFGLIGPNGSRKTTTVESVEGHSCRAFSDLGPALDAGI